MTIYNGTGSVRTSFALYGTLSSGASIGGKTGNIFVCVGPITVTKRPQTFAVGTITFVCGQELSLKNNFLAWTDASGNTSDRCETFSNATKCADIAPKCGTADNIVIRAPLTASAKTGIDPCIGSTTKDGSIIVDPSGGLAPYKIVVVAKGTANCASSVPSGATQVTSNTGEAVTISNLAAGTYCIYVTDANGCLFPVFTQTIGKPCCVNPGKPTICQVRPSACGTETKVLLRVSGLTANSDYHVKQGGVEISGSPKAASTAVNGVLTFNLNPGGGTLSVYGTQTVNGTTCTGTAATCDDLTECATGSGTLTQKSETTLSPLPESQSRIIAAPNPFNDRVRFSITPGASGYGTLNLYNTLGQKVKTVYQGQVQKGQTQTIEYSVPFSQRNLLLYQFQVGKERLSGKLLGQK